MNTDIVFDNQGKAYSPGEIISGQVQINCTEAKSIKYITLKFEGWTSVCWHEQMQRKVERKPEYYNQKFWDSKVHFCDKVVLMGNNDIDSRKIYILKDGLHNYNFRYHLPFDLPSSWKGEFGFTEYSVGIKIDLPWESQHKSKEEFTIISKLDLNLVPQASEPFKIEIEENAGWGPCRSGPLKATITAPRMGMAMSKVIPFIIKVKNDTRKTVESIEIEILRIMQYRAKYPQAKTKKTVTAVRKVNFGRVKSHDKREINADVEIPKLEPTYVHNIIENYYKISIKFVVNGLCNQSIIRRTHRLIIGSTTFEEEDHLPIRKHKVGFFSKVKMIIINSDSELAAPISER